MSSLRKMQGLRLVGLVAAGLLINLAASLGAGDKAITDASKAGPSLAAQGEYLGEIKNNPDGLKVGVQVIALGKDEYEAVAYIGGLPGEGWSRGDRFHRVKGKLTDDGIRFEGEDGGSGTIKDGVLIARNPSGETVAELKKVERKSPTLGAKPPEGAVVLFDGKNVDAWKDGQMTEDKLLKVGTTSKQEFKDYTLHLEFRTPYMPESRGQGRGNSGMYLNNRYEVQVLDSFGLDGADNECGGIYSVSKPDVNMCYPPLSWQTYDVEFTAARFDSDGKKTADARTTIKHNGVVIHDKLMLKHTPGGASSEAPGSGPLMLQNHGDPVVFRNIWLVEKK